MFEKAKQRITLLSRHICTVRLLESLLRGYEAGNVYAMIAMFNQLFFIVMPC